MTQSHFSTDSIVPRDETPTLASLCFLGMHHMDFFQPILITQNDLLLMTNTIKITDSYLKKEVYTLWFVYT